ncbi:TonB-dependent receptor [Akkermansiaceae bacterium]|nr:TonB-dependent receptor [Akkermansiaceae bacterium]MDA8974327.1 TonB-dependent receptor [Akkermansiaceae bacterium]MDB4376913.1 TonB-dependent receptor [Akkermansiaceae bacterium]MDB4531937.1 TonB-dependent receptor [Akkermansiaceae bacterium]MDB4558439.1 TonB-dependent receptor [Akkermansiaceae bacterium]
MKQFGFCLSALLLGGFLNAQDLLKPLVVEGDAVGNVALETLDAERLNELLGYLPGFASVASDSAGYGDVIGMRGSTNTLFFGGAGVAMVVDDVPYGDVFGYSTEFFDLESFTLHRGPQGSRFARNGVGGLMELRTPGPTKEHEHGFSAEYGSYNLTHLRFRSSGPLDKDWSYGFQTYFKERDGLVDNVTLGRDTDTREQFGTLGSLYYNPSEDLEVRFRLMYERTRDGSQRLSALPGVTSAFGDFVDSQLAKDPFKVASNVPGVTEVDRLQLSMHLDQDFGKVNLKSITAFSNWKLGPNTVDLDLTAFDLSRSSIRQEQNLFSQEFRLQSDQEVDVRWLSGLAYLNKDNQGVANRFFPLFDNISANQFTNFDIDEESFALFGNVQWDAVEDLTIEVGGRLESIENSISRSKTEPGGGFIPLPPAFAGESNGVYFSPSLGATYVVNSETSVFARTSLSYKPQGFTAFSDNAATTDFDEEQSLETEIGVRYQSPDQSLGGELRGYFKQIDDYQLNQSIPMTTDFIIANADRVKALGVEGEVIWKPVSGLTVQASAGWNQIEFEEHTGTGGADLSGNDVPFLPEFTAGMVVRYDFENGFFAQTGVRAVGATFFDETNNSDYRQGSYEVLDAQLGYQGDSWNAAIFARNLLDEDYYSFMNNQISAGVAGDPEMYGVRVALEF